MTDASPNQCETVIFVISCQYVRVITKSLNFHSTLVSAGTLPQDQELSAFPPQEPGSKFGLRVVLFNGPRTLGAG